jgi:hypothetical protein
MRDSFDYCRMANPAANYKALNKAMAAREELMCRHVKFILSQMGQKENAILAEVGSIYLLPTDTMDAQRADLLKSEIDIAGIYNATFRTAISRQADAIFFVNKVNPLKP